MTFLDITSLSGNPTLSLHSRVLCVGLPFIKRDRDRLQNTVVLVLLCSSPGDFTLKLTVHYRTDYKWSPDWNGPIRIEDPYQVCMNLLHLIHSLIINASTVTKYCKYLRKIKFDALIFFLSISSNRKWSPKTPVYSYFGKTKSILQKEKGRTSGNTVWIHSWQSDLDLVESAALFLPPITPSSLSLSVT